MQPYFITKTPEQNVQIMIEHSIVVLNNITKLWSCNSNICSIHCRLKTIHSQPCVILQQINCTSHTLYWNVALQYTDTAYKCWFPTLVQLYQLLSTSALSRSSLEPHTSALAPCSFPSVRARDSWINTANSTPW